MKTTLVGTRSFEEFTMKYYRTEKKDGETFIYGTRLEKHVSCKLEESLSVALTDNFNQINEIIDRLIGGAVTTTGLTETVDYIYNETLYTISV